MPRKKDKTLHLIRQQQILEAAKQCFVVHGFHKTTMRQIFAAANISAGGAYNYFSSKGDIVKRLIEEERADIELLTKRLKKQKNPLLGIAQLLCDAISYTDYEEAVIQTEIYAEYSRNEEMATLHHNNMGQLRALIKETLLIGRKNGVITTQYSVEDLIEWLLAMLEGYIVRLASNKKLNPKRNGRMAKMAVLNFLRHGGK